MYYLTCPSWDTSYPNTSPPALYDTRYNGWPSSPIQLHRVAASPLFRKPAERHVAFAIDTPSNVTPLIPNLTRFISNMTLALVQILGRKVFAHYLELISSVDTMWPVEYRRHDVFNSCMWNGGTHQNPSLQGVFETRTATRHDEENGAIKHGPAQRTKNSMPLINKDTQIAYLLAAPYVPMLYDMRYPLDMTMPSDITFDSGDSYFGANLTDYVNDGYISTARLDDMATRIIAAWYFLHQDEGYPATNFNVFSQNDEATNNHAKVQADHYKLVGDIGAAGTVLFKNTNGAV
ncbi:hypothetical protein EDB19DRAFT_1910460 [Suillus lakei]|nr:hypothetical protein EDB19DRAFT_1910460 [Suillus lakei]